MKICKLAIIAILSIPLLSGCTVFGTGTTMYYPSGHKAFATSGDNAGIQVDIKDGTWEGHFKAVTNTHSTVVKSRGDAYSEFVGAAGDAIGKAGAAFVKGATKL